MVARPVVTVSGHRDFTDGNILDVFKAFRQPDGSALPDTVFLATPTQSHVLGLGAAQGCQGVIDEVALGARNLVLLPVNDSSLKA